MRRLASIILAVALVLAACSDQARLGYLALSGRVFIFNPRIATATYVVTLAVTRAPPAGSRVRAEFENPAGGEKLRVERPVRPGQTKVALESEPLRCVRKGKRYAFTVVLVDADGAVLQTIDSSIESTLDQSVLPDVPLVEGPGYEPNPAVASPSAQALRKREDNCPAG